MAATIKIKNSSTTGAVPTSGDLVQGELAVNVTDTGLYTENASGTVVKLNAPSIDDKNTGATKHLTIDTSGNLGLGVTPSAWGSGQKAVQIGASGVLNGSTNTSLFSVGANTFFNGTANTYINTAAASLYLQLSGAHQWYNAASGSAGGTISFTQAMTLDASGNLGVGTTSPTQKLQVAGKIAVSGTNPSIQQIVQNSYLDLCGGTTVGTDPSIQIAGSTTTSDANKIFYNSNTHVFRSSSGGTTYSTIDSSGNLLVGTTGVPNGTSIYGSAFVPVSFNRTRLAMASSSTASLEIAQFFNPNGQVGSISTSGSATAYTTSSDYRLKHDVAPMTGALNRVTALKPVTYKWNADNADGEGFIAHELAEVCPDAVHGEKDAVDEDGNPVYQAIDTSFLVATLTAAIQELKAEFDAYKAAHP